METAWEQGYATVALRHSGNCFHNAWGIWCGRENSRVLLPLYESLSVFWKPVMTSFPPPPPPPPLELSFLETSALTGENVEEVFLKCTRTILTKIDGGTVTTCPDGVWSQCLFLWCIVGVSVSVVIMYVSMSVPMMQGCRQVCKSREGWKYCWSDPALPCNVDYIIQIAPLLIISPILYVPHIEYKRGSVLPVRVVIGSQQNCAIAIANVVTMLHSG